MFKTFILIISRQESAGRSTVSGLSAFNVHVKTSLHLSCQVANYKNNSSVFV